MASKVRFGSYGIVESIGEGGMCRVFRARRDDLGVDCALKVLKDELRNDARIRDLFLTEADLSLLLRHPNLIRTYDAGEAEGRAYIAMELLEGGTLSDLTRRLREQGSVLPVDLAVHIVREMLAGLDALHEATGDSGRPLGIVHRDVTPQNVFLGLDGRVVLGDYGVAHVEAHGADLEDSVPGKLTYLAPENLTQEAVDRRADIFSAGVLLYELLIGRRPFESEQESTTMDLLVDGRAPPRLRRFRPELPRELEAIVLGALSRRPRDRPSTARTFNTSLEPFVDTQLGNGRLLGSLMEGLRRN